MRTLLSLVLFFSFSASALASCPASLELKDANGVTAPGKYTDDGSGNCQVNTAEQDGANATIGSKSDSAWASGSGSLVALLKAIAGDVGTFIPGVSRTQTSAAASSLVAKSAAGSLLSVSGSAVAGSYIMIFDASSAPSDGSVTPLKCWGPIASASPFVFGWGPGPALSFSTGITIVSSSTGCFTKTATNANFISAEYQ